ncbi:MAG: methionyl-tRNA formyltransferase [Candidatus Delongbacteria bacterium]|nr:methionyl-tRNA formyltransferase [Candidatus Delongbacteria bacterium]MCG2760089.1 methionyl-tRNA formyltransferase [Candidatus Delongbacteria bacterium]
MNDRSIIFMGSPDFAVCSLEALYNKGINIKAVVTQPDKERGRGKKISYTAVKAKALELGLPILQPVSMRNPDFIENLKELNADLFVVVAFRVLPSMVLYIPKFGSINLHASLLPDYRGAAPINYAIFNGEKETGLTVFFLNSKEIDSGDIINQVKIPIDTSDNFGSLYDKLSNIGAGVLVDTVMNIFSGNYTSFRQNEISFKKAPKLFPINFKIDWDESADVIFNKIRGLSPKPGAYTILNGKRIKIISATYELASHNFEAGLIKEVNQKSGTIKVTAENGYIIITELQPENKPVLDTKSFLNGHKLKIGDKFG